MLPIETIRNNPETVEKRLNSKGETIAISEILKIDTLYRKQMGEANDLRALRNKVSDEIAEAKRAGEDSNDSIQAMRKVSQQIKDLEEKAQSSKIELDGHLELLILATLPLATLNTLIDILFHLLLEDIVLMNLKLIMEV